MSITTGALEKFAHSFMSITATQQAPASLTSTISNAASVGTMIPNFVSFLSAYNQQIDPKIARVRISVQKNFWGKTQALSIFLLPADGTAAVMTPTLTALVARMKSGINLYFSTYPETIDDLASDIYVLELPV